MKQIVSRDNPHFKALKKLCSSGRERRKANCIVLEGMHLIQSYRQFAGSAIDEVVVSQGGCQGGEVSQYLASLPADQRLTQFADSLFSDLAQVEAPSGILAIAPLPIRDSAPALDCDTVVLDGLQDPGNVGSILRSAAAAGFKQVILSKDCAQAWSPKVLRAGMGAHFQLNVHEGMDLCAFLASYCGQAMLTTLDKQAHSLYSADLKHAVAWVFGNEGQGVSSAVADLVRCHVRIPMPGESESLNVAAAAAICLFETVRQRLPG